MEKKTNTKIEVNAKRKRKKKYIFWQLSDISTNVPRNCLPFFGKV